MPDDTNEQERKNLAHERAKEVLGVEPEEFVNPLTVLASPAWRGVEADIWRASARQKSSGLWRKTETFQSIILKHYHPDTQFYVNTKHAVLAAQQAGIIGVGPTVLRGFEEDHLVVFEDLVNPWRAGGLHDAVDATIRAKVIENKKHFQSKASLENEASIFDEIEALYKIVQTHDLTTHKDLSVFVDFFRDAKEKISSLGSDLIPCHRDGNSANIMVGADQAVKLIDFDLAAKCDPFEDIGCYLIEFFECDADARQGFEEWYGQFHEGLFQRSMIYGLADDMRSALIAAILASQSPRVSLEFAKYAAWRFLRLEMQAKRSDVYNRIRCAA